MRYKVKKKKISNIKYIIYVKMLYRDRPALLVALTKDDT